MCAAVFFCLSNKLLWAVLILFWSYFACCFDFDFIYVIKRKNTPHKSSQKWKREKKVKWYFEKKISWFIFVSLFLHGFHSSCCDIYKQNEIWHDIRCSFGFNNIGFVIDLVCQLISLSICTFFDPFPLRNFFNWIHNPRTEIGKIDQLLADWIGTVFKLIPFNKTWALVT